MKYWTRDEIVAKLKGDLKLDEYSGVVEDSTLYEYINDAIDDIEAQIHTLYEDYFLTRALLTLVQGQDEIALPTDIFAMKIRGIVYFKDNKLYEVPRIKEFKKFLKYREARLTSSNYQDYRYFLYNAVAGSPKILLSPPALESSATVMEIWYLRNANRLATGTDKCDVPEGIQYIFWHVKELIYGDEGHYLHKVAVDKALMHMQDLQATLAAMVPDTDNELEPDLSSYYEQDGIC